MTHSVLTRMVKLALLNIVCLIFLTLEGQSQIGCGMTIDASITPNPKCGVMPVCSCPYEGKVQTLTVVYQGATGVDINIWNKPSHEVLITAYSNVQYGDTLVANAIGILDDDELENETLFEIIGGDEIEIDSKCNNMVPGSFYGDFLVTGYSDTEGFFCEISNCRAACKCEGKLTEITVKYTGPSGVDVNVYEDDNQAVLVEAFTDVSSGQILNISAENLGGGDFKNDTWFQIVGEGMISIPTNCDENIQAGQYGEFQVVAFIDGQGDTCESFGIGVIDLTVSGNGPFTFEWSDGSTEEDLAKACDGEYSCTVTDDNGCSLTQTYVVNFTANSLVSVLGETVPPACFIEVPKICFCKCIGEMYELTLLYNGESSVDVNMWNNANHDLLLATFNDVQQGDVLVVSAIGITPDDLLENKTFVEIVGGAEEEIKTDCNEQIAGVHYGDFQVIAHEDDGGGICDATDCIPQCDCNQKMRYLTVQYLGLGPVDVNLWSEDDNTGLIQSFANIEYGDILQFTAVGNTENNVFPNSIYLEESGVETHFVHASCSVDLLNVILGNFRVIHFLDGAGDTCNDLGCTGSIEIDIPEGVGPFEFQWSNGENTQNISGLCAGVHTVEIYDANACKISQEVVLDCDCNGNDSPACFVMIGTENISCILGGNFEEPTLQCNPIAGSLDGSTPSPEAYSDANTGEDVWYMFTAVFPGVSIYVESEDFDVILELQDRFGNLVDVENKVGGLGAELLNIGSLVEGESYLLGVRAADGYANAGDFSVCITELPDSRCDRFGPFDLCHIFKADWVCADDYLFHFTNLETGELTTHQSGYPYTFVQWIEIPIHNWGSEFQIEAFPIYHIEDGAGNLEYITIDNNEPCVVETVPMPTAELDLSDRCETLGPQFLGGYIAASPWICSASDWTWEFQRVDQGELPIIHSRGEANRFMQISDVPGLQHGATYNVRVKPEFVTGEPTSYGGFQCLQIIGGVGVPFHTAQDYTLNFETDVKTAVQEGFMATVPETPDFEMLLDEYHARQLAAYPNPTVSGDFTLDIAGMNEAQGMLEILDVSGKLVYQENLTLTGERQLISMSIGEYLAPGMYQIALRTGSGISTTSLVVGK